MRAFQYESCKLCNIFTVVISFVWYQTLISEGRIRGQIARSRAKFKDTGPEGRMSSSRFSQLVWKSLFTLANHIFLQHVNRHVFKRINEMAQEMTKMLAFTDWFEDFAPLQIMSRRPSSHALDNFDFWLVNKLGSIICSIQSIPQWAWVKLVEWRHFTVTKRACAWKRLAYRLHLERLVRYSREQRASASDVFESRKKTESEYLVCQGTVSSRFSN